MGRPGLKAQVNVSGTDLDTDEGFQLRHAKLQLTFSLGFMTMDYLHY